MSADAFDRVDLAVMANRFDGIVREMENTLLRTARSSVIGLCRDFSCSIVSARDELVASAEGLPVHVYGSGLVSHVMRTLHPDLAEGDAFLHNDPYDGNTHAADHTILVPMFFDGEHRFTGVVKAHQADIGNAVPTTYCPDAEDVYAEGALIFPCVRMQRDFTDVEDIVRMCMRRIRVPEVWYGDYLAMVAAGRIAERRLHELYEKYGAGRMDSFVHAWLDYGEHRAAEAIRTLPTGRIHATTELDPFPSMPDGLPLQVTLEVDGERGRVTVDLRDNPDCTPNGFNLTEATAKNSAVAPILMVLNSRRGDTPPIPLNAGSLGCFDVLVRENCVAGIPVHPHSCSMATGEVGVRIWAMVMTAFAGSPTASGPRSRRSAVPPTSQSCLGDDPRAGHGPYVTQLLAGTRRRPGDCGVRRLAELPRLPRGRPPLPRLHRGAGAEVPHGRHSLRGPPGLRGRGTASGSAREPVRVRADRRHHAGLLVARRGREPPRRRAGRGVAARPERVHGRHDRDSGGASRDHRRHRAAALRASRLALRRWSRVRARLRPRPRARAGGRP